MQLSASRARPLSTSDPLVHAGTSTSIVSSQKTLLSYIFFRKKQMRLLRYSKNKNCQIWVFFYCFVLIDLSTVCEFWNLIRDIYFVQSETEILLHHPRTPGYDNFFFNNFFSLIKKKKKKNILNYFIMSNKKSSWRNTYKMFFFFC